MNFLFTKSHTPGSWLIRKVTGEDCSHCALQLGDLVLHATEGGVRVFSLEHFLSKNTVIHTVDRPDDTTFFLSLIKKYEGQGYDYLALLFLGVRYILQKVGLPCPKVNLWQSSNLFICTEFLSLAAEGEIDSLITPFKLYKKLQEQQK